MPASQLRKALGTPDAQAPEIQISPPAHRLRRLLITAVLCLTLIAAWLILHQLQTRMTAGRPLSYPQTHLHAVVFGGKPGVLYLGTHYGLFTSTDNGQTWPQS